MVAIVQTYQPREVDRVFSPTPVQAGQTAMGNLAQGMTDIADAAWTFEDELATAHAYQVDTEFSTLLRETMDNPETGYRQTRGLTAVQRGQEVLQEVQQRYRAMITDLNPRVREATLRSMEGRWQTFVSAVQSHSRAQARAGAAAASRARIEAAQEDGIRAILAGDPAGYETAMGVVRATIEDSPAYQAADPAERDRLMRNATSDLHVATLDVVASEQGARAALAYLDEHRDEMSTDDLLTLQPRLYSAAQDEEGAEQGNTAFDEVLAEPPAWGGLPEPTIGDEVQNFGLGNPAELQQSAYDAGDVALSSEYGVTVQQGFTADERDMITDFSAGFGATELQNPAVRPYVGAVRVPDQSVMTGRRYTSTPTPQGFVDTMPLMPERPQAFIQPPEFVRPPTIEEARADLEQIENPRIRAAALESFDLRVTQWEAEQERVHDAAVAQAYDLVERGAHPITGIPPSTRAMLTPQEQSALITYSRNLAGALDPDTPDEVFYELSLLRDAGDTRGLAAALQANRTQISASDYRTFTTDLASMQADAAEVPQINFGEVRTVIDRELRAFSVSTTSTASEEDRAIQMRVQNEVERWMRREAEGGTMPDQGQVRAYTQELLTSITMDTWSIGDAVTMRGVQIDFDGVTQTPDDDLTIERLSDVAAANGLTVNGVSVSMEDLSQVEETLARSLGRAPTAREVWGALSRITLR